VAEKTQVKTLFNFVFALRCASKRFYNAEPILDKPSDWRWLDDALGRPHSNVIRFARGIGAEIHGLMRKRSGERARH
jgi:hypothetical protein